MRMKAVAIGLMAGMLATPALADEPKHSWSGFYMGLHGGIDMSSTEASVPGFLSIDGLSGNGHGYGVHIGYDHQFGMIVVGIGADYTWSDSDFNITSPLAPATIIRAGIDESWSVYGRVGIDAGRVMPYVLAGYSEADASASILGTNIGSTTLSGLMVGGGFEMRISGGITLGAEYRYTMFDTEKVIPDVIHLDTDRHEVRAKMSYKFGGLF